MSVRLSLPACPSVCMYQRVAGRSYVTFSIVGFRWGRNNSNLVKIGHFKWRPPCVFMVDATLNCYTWYGRGKCTNPVTAIISNSIYAIWCIISLNNGPYSNVSQTVLLAYPTWLRKITTDPHSLAHVNTKCSDEMYAKLKTHILELISES